MPFLWNSDRRYPTPPHTKRWRAPRISEETRKSIDTKVSLCRYPTHDQTRIRVMGWQIKSLLNGDKSWQAVEYLLASDPPLVK